MGVLLQLGMQTVWTMMMMSSDKYTCRQTDQSRARTLTHNYL